jgi:hypothetical protein
MLDYGRGKAGAEQRVWMIRPSRSRQFDQGSRSPPAAEMFISQPSDGIGEPIMEPALRFYSVLRTDTLQRGEIL